VIVPVGIGAADEAGIHLDGRVAGGGRRAGLLGHRYELQFMRSGSSCPALVNPITRRSVRPGIVNVE